jgi:hypothetical protein
MFPGAGAEYENIKDAVDIIASRYEYERTRISG